VLGDGSHPNPAAELAPVIREIKRSKPELEVIVVIIGTDDDPQDLQSQTERFMEAGAVVLRTVTDAVNHINMRLGKSTPIQYPPINIEQLTQPIAAINVGLESFYESLISQHAQAIHVEWRPPAGGNERMAALLARMKSKKEN
jgi:FdrA protein